MSDGQHSFRAPKRLFSAIFICATLLAVLADSAHCQDLDDQEEEVPAAVDSEQVDASDNNADTTDWHIDEEWHLDSEWRNGDIVAQTFVHNIEDYKVRLESDVEVSKLVDLAAATLRLNISYDRNMLRMRTSMRFLKGIRVGDLWAVTVSKLLENGLVAIEDPAGPGLSILPIAAAKSRTPVRTDVPHSNASYARMLVPLVYVAPAEIVNSIRERNGTNWVEVDGMESARAVVLSGFIPDVLATAEVVKSLDRNTKDESFIELECKYCEATELAELAGRLLVQRRSTGQGDTPLTVIARRDRNTVVVSGTRVDVERVQQLLELIDQPRGEVLGTYSPLALGSNELRVLVQSELKTWGGGRVELDAKRDRLLVWCSDAGHQAIRTLIERLESGVEATQLVVRTYSVKHRPVQEVFDVVSPLLDDLGAVDPLAESEQSALADAPRMDGSALRDRSRERHLTNPPTSPAKILADLESNLLFAVVEQRQVASLDRLVEMADQQVREVLVEAAIFALSESDLLAIGTRLQALDFGSGSGSQLDVGFDEAVVPVSGTLPVDLASNGFNLIGLNSMEWSATLSALERRTGSSSVTLPRITVANNDEATLSSTLESPFVAVNASDTVATTTFGGSLSAGTVLTVRPFVMGGDRINVEYRVSVSSFVGDPAAPQLPPSRQISEFGSQLQLRSGEGGLVGGLVLQSSQTSRAGVPLLSRIPLVGSLFGDRSDSGDSTRLFLLLRASVAPLEEGADAASGGLDNPLRPLGAREFAELLRGGSAAVSEGSTLADPAE